MFTERANAVNVQAQRDLEARIMAGRYPGYYYVLPADSAIVKMMQAVEQSDLPNPSTGICNFSIQGSNVILNLPDGNAVQVPADEFVNAYIDTLVKRKPTKFVDQRSTSDIQVTKNEMTHAPEVTTKSNKKVLAVSQTTVNIPTPVEMLTPTSTTTYEATSVPNGGENDNSLLKKLIGWGVALGALYSVLKIGQIVKRYFSAPITGERDKKSIKVTRFSGSTDELAKWRILETEQRNLRERGENTIDDYPHPTADDIIRTNEATRHRIGEHQGWEDVFGLPHMESDYRRPYRDGAGRSTSVEPTPEEVHTLYERKKADEANAKKV